MKWQNLNKTITKSVNIHSMLKRTIIIFLLPLLFIFSQQVAITHEISHYGESAPLTQSKDSSKHSSVCDKCVAYGEMASALDSPSFHIPVIPTISNQIDGYQYTQSRHVVFSYQARGPPLFS